MTLGVRWLSVAAGSGYGNAAAAYLSGLRDAGVPLTWAPIGWPSTVWNAPLGPVKEVDPGTPHEDLVNLPVSHDTVLLQAPPLWHERLVQEADGRTLVAYTTWETDRLPSAWPAILNRFDKVLVPSQFNAEVFASSGVRRPIEVVPHISPRMPARQPQPPSSKFTFYVINSWSARKALGDLVNAYLRAFSAADDVRLVIHTTPEDLIVTRQLAEERAPGPEFSSWGPGSSWYTLARLLGGRQRVPEVTLSTRWLTAQEVEALHLASDCFVSLSRGEGWGLGPFEAAAHGNPVIVTGWGASREFLAPDYPYLVDYRLVPAINDPPDILWEPEPGHRWAKASTEHAAELMRHVYQHPDEARMWGRRLASSITRRYESGTVTGRLIAALS